MSKALDKSMGVAKLLNVLSRDSRLILGGMLQQQVVEILSNMSLKFIRRLGAHANC